jgi:hypothetical protein
MLLSPSFRSWLERQAGPAALLSVLLSLAGQVACGDGVSSPKARPPTAPAVPIAPEPAAIDYAEPVSSGASSAPAWPSASEPPPKPAAPPLVPHSTPIELAPGKSCTLEWTVSDFEELDDYWRVIVVRRIATVAGGACKQSVFWDLDAGIGVGCDASLHDMFACDPSVPPDSLNGGILTKPGATPPQEAMGVELVDWNFDGYRDLCVMDAMGAYNYSQKCWLFRPKSGVFERYEPLDDIIWAKPDPRTKTIKNGMRLGGPEYMSQRLGWERGELVVLERTTTILGGKPDGPPLPAGFDAWEIVERRVGGKLVQVSEGPTAH